MIEGPDVNASGPSASALGEKINAAHAKERRPCFRSRKRPAALHIGSAPPQRFTPNRAVDRRPRAAAAPTPRARSSRSKDTRKQAVEACSDDPLIMAETGRPLTARRGGPREASMQRGRMQPGAEPEHGEQEAARPRTGDRAGRDVANGVSPVLACSPQKKPHQDGDLRRFRPRDCRDSRPTLRTSSHCGGACAVPGRRRQCIVFHITMYNTHRRRDPLPHSFWTRKTWGGTPSTAGRAAVPLPLRKYPSRKCGHFR